jgi:hypothetical protein
MGLYERLIGVLNEPKIPVHQFMAAIGEVERGKWTNADAIAAFTLTPSEQAEAATLIARIITPLESISLGGFVNILNVGAAYDSTIQSQGLGVARVQTAGITAFEWTVRVQKNGTGTQSWQLWDETNSAEITVIDDPGATGSKELAISRVFAPPLGAGLRTVRVRTRSTVAADDPVYFGSALVIRRVERLTSVELHEVLCLAEVKLSPYDTPAAVKARLGV